MKEIHPLSGHPGEWQAENKHPLLEKTRILWPSDVKSLMLGKTEGRRRRGQHGQDGWMASPTQWS